jgi:ElaB/YqjD/DUF883 family membrane-anchored ribosome-binding protein
MDQDTSTLRADIERERRELGETVAALAEKADVKGQAKRKISETRETIDEKKDQVVAGGQHAAGLDHTPGAGKRRAIAIGAAVGVLVLVTAIARRR